MDDDDDPQLRSMRAAWRALPDEDPPERGLAELMAAARKQAEVMAEARTPWWKRLMASLLRPPMLALASVVVLLGGLFVVTSTHKGVSPEPSPIEDQRAAPASTTPAIGGEPAPGAAAGSAAAPAPAPTPTPDLAAPAHGATIDSLEQKKLEVEEKPRPVAPAKHRAVEKEPAPSNEARGPQGNTASPPEPPPPPPAKPARSEAPKLEPPATPAPAPAPASARDRDSTGAAASDSSEGDAPEQTRAPVAKKASATPVRRQLDDQLLAQCRSAATSGDCETARKIAQRIALDDPGYYNDHVTSDPAIAKCLGK
jgi:outer membrane biosynthesis protein TonB